MSEIMVIDMGSLAVPIWMMASNDADPDSTATKIVERVRALATGYEHVAIACDSRESFRRDLDPTYKANREQRPAAMYYQIDRAKEILKADGFPVWSVPGYEADDILSTATAYALTHSANISVLLVSSDKDVLQLLHSPRVRAKSLQNGTVYDAAAVKEKFGVAPHQIIDYLTLVGDAADGVKGANRIGPKTAARLLNQFDSLAGIWDAKLLPQLTEGITPSLVTALKEFKPRAALVQQLLTLRTDAPIPFDEIWKDRMPSDAKEFADDIDFALRPLTEEEAPTRVDDDARIISSASNEGDSGAAPAPAGHYEAGRAPTGGQIGVVPSRGDSEQPVEVLPAPVEWNLQLEPRSMREAKQLAADLFASRLFSAYGHPAAVLSTILAGREFGLQAIASLRAMHLIDGKQAFAADLIRALVLRSGKAEYFICTERSAEKATFETKRKGDPKPIALTYTLAEGRQAWPKDERAFAASGWGRNPADMCIARAGAKLARLVYPDVIHGLYAREEFD